MDSILEQEVQDYIDALLVKFGLLGYRVESSPKGVYVLHCDISNDKRSVVLTFSASIFTTHLYRYGKTRWGSNVIQPVRTVSSSVYDVMDMLKIADEWLMFHSE